MRNPRPLVGYQYKLLIELLLSLHNDKTDPVVFVRTTQ